MPVRLVIFICHPLLLVSCNDRRGVDYATTLTQALLQVLASYTIRSVFFQFLRPNSHSHALTSRSHPIPIPWLILLPFPWESQSYRIYRQPQRQYQTALTRALKIKTALQHKFKFGNSMLKTGYSRSSNNIIRKRIPRISNMVTQTK